MHRGVMLSTIQATYQQPHATTCKSDLQMEHAYLAQHIPELKLEIQDVQPTHAHHGKLLPLMEHVPDLQHTNILELHTLEHILHQLIQEPM